MEQGEGLKRGRIIRPWDMAQHSVRKEAQVHGRLGEGGSGRRKRRIKSKLEIFKGGAAGWTDSVLFHDIAENIERLRCPRCYSNPSPPYTSSIFSSFVVPNQNASPHYCLFSSPRYLRVAGPRSTRIFSFNTCCGIAYDSLSLWYDRLWGGFRPLYSGCFLGSLDTRYASHRSRACVQWVGTPDDVNGYPKRPVCHLL